VETYGTVRQATDDSINSAQKRCNLQAGYLKQEQTLIIFNTYGFSTVTQQSYANAPRCYVNCSCISTYFFAKRVSLLTSVYVRHAYLCRFSSTKSGPGLRRPALSSPVLYNEGEKFVLYFILQVCFCSNVGTRIKYLCDKDQQDSLFTFSFILVNNLYMFRASLLLIIRRNSYVYTAIGIYHAFMSTGC
jgi:hypothetical protein